MRKADRKHSTKAVPSSASLLILRGHFETVQTIIGALQDVATSESNLAGSTYQVPGGVVELLAGQLHDALAPIRAALLGLEMRS